MEVICANHVSIFGRDFEIQQNDDGSFSLPEEMRRLAPYGTALKPAREPCILARKPLDGTVVQTVLEHGTGALAIDACRIGNVGYPKADPVSASVSASVSAYGDGLNGGGSVPTLGGRWPANIVLTHDSRCTRVGTKRVSTGTAFRTNGGGRTFGGDEAKPALADMSYAGPDGKEGVEVWECVEACPIAILDAQSGDRPGMSGGGVHRADYGGGMFGGIDSAGTARGDSGGASRFFFQAKASRFEREFGCDELPARAGFEAVERDEGAAGVQNPLAGAGRTAEKVRNYHPTVKPVALARYLARLVLPPGRGRRLLVPYAGVGSEMIGALRAGWDHVVGIQRADDEDERGYIRIAHARLKRWAEVPDHVEPSETTAAPEVDPGQRSLFG